jgi:hypothetical protein
LRQRKKSPARSVAVAALAGFFFASSAAGGLTRRGVCAKIDERSLRSLSNCNHPKTRKEHANPRGTPLGLFFSSEPSLATTEAVVGVDWVAEIWLASDRVYRDLAKGGIV